MGEASVVGSNLLPVDNSGRERGPAVLASKSNPKNQAAPCHGGEPRSGRDAMLMPS